MTKIQSKKLISQYRKVSKARIIETNKLQSRLGLLLPRVPLKDRFI